MNRRTNTENTILFFIVSALMVVGLMYVVRMPTSKPMNFMLLTLTVGSAISVMLAYKYPTLAEFIKWTRYLWLTLMMTGIILTIVNMLCLVGKFGFPFGLEQWTGLIQALALVGWVVAPWLEQAYDEATIDYWEAQKAKGSTVSEAKLVI